MISSAVVLYSLLRALIEMKKILVIGIIVSSFVFLLFSMSGAGVKEEFTEIIIKVESDIIVLPEGTYTAPLSEIRVISEPLQELNKRYNLVSIEKMYVVKKPADEIAGEFPEREARAPEDSVVPGLENTFLFKFPGLVDVEELIREYEALEEVEYAEENKKVSIY